MSTQALYLEIDISESLSSEWKVPNTSTLSFVVEELVLKIPSSRILHSVKNTLESCNIKVIHLEKHSEIIFAANSIKAVVFKDRLNSTSEMLDNADTTHFDKFRKDL